jgi:hypothetical protein
VTLAPPLKINVIEMKMQQEKTYMNMDSDKATGKVAGLVRKFEMMTPMNNL